MPRPVEISIQEERMQLEEESVRELVDAIDAYEGYPIPAGSLEIAFVDVPTCCQLHSDFFGDQDITDVMTFPGDPDDQHAGDIAVCPQVAFNVSHESGLSFSDELSLYIVHACLHLSGLKDDSPENLAHMRLAEEELMYHLASRNAFLRCNWKEVV